MHLETIARRIPTVLLVAGLVWLGGVQSVGAQADVWRSNGPYGGSVIVLAIDPEEPTIVYAGTGNGVFKSESGGSSWEDASNGLTNRSVVGLAIDPRRPATLYVGTGGGLFKSTDAGRSWNAIGSSLPSTYIRALAVDPLTPSTLYASVSGIIFKSTDAGSSWIRSDAGIRWGGVEVLAIDPQTPTTLYAGSHDGAFKSVDGGASWSVLTGLYTRGTYIPTIAIDPQTPATLYASNFDDRIVYKSIDRGLTWTPSNTGLSTVRVYRLAIDPQNPSTLYASTTGGAFKSADGGGTWRLLNIFGSVMAIDPQTPTTLYAGTQGPGVFKSTDGGGNWTAVSDGLIATAVTSVAIDPESPSTLYATTNNGVHRSTDEGDTWSALNTGLFGFALAIDSQIPTTLYAGGYASTGERGVFKSTDGGRSWNLIGLAGVAVSSLVIDPHNSNILYAGTTSSDGVFRSLDGGATWSAVNSGLTARNVWALAIDSQNPATLYAGTGYNYPDICRGVFKTTDGGNSWIELGPRDRSISSVAIDPHTPTTLYASSNQWSCSGGGPQDPGIYKSTDGGGSWVAVSPHLTTALAIDPQTATTIYAATRDSGVFRSTDDGTTWNDFDSGLTNLSIAALTLTPTTAYAGTAGGGVFARPTPHSPLTIDKSDCGSNCSTPYLGGASVTSTATQLPAASAPWPNELAGWGHVNDQPWDALTGSGWSWLRRASSQDPSIVADATAPLSPQSVLQMVFTPDMGYGNEPSVHWIGLPWVEEIYTGWWVKLSPNWTCSLNEWCTHVTYLFAQNGLGQVYTVYYHPSEDQAGPPYRIGANTEWAPYFTHPWYPNVTTTWVFPGEWHRIEFYYKWETTPGVSGDGIIRWWVDGVLNGDYTNVHYPSERGFQEFQHAPTFGTPPAEQYMFVDHTHVSFP